MPYKWEVFPESQIFSESLRLWDFCVRISRVWRKIFYLADVWIQRIMYICSSSPHAVCGKSSAWSASSTPDWQDTFSPRNLANVAMALSMRGVRDVPTVEFIRTLAGETVALPESQGVNFTMDSLLISSFRLGCVAHGMAQE